LYNAFTRIQTLEAASDARHEQMLRHIDGRLELDDEVTLCREAIRALNMDLVDRDSEIGRLKLALAER
jgi:hypothetical protein